MALDAPVVLSGLQAASAVRVCAPVDLEAPDGWTRLLASVAQSLGTAALTQPGLCGWTPAASLAWQPQRSRLAVVDGQNRVVIYATESLQLKEATPERLTHAGIRDIAAVAWRPNAKSVLAVAHAGGICLWTCDTNPQPAARAVSGVRGLGVPSSWRRELLHCGRKYPVTALCWSPCGQFLASGSPADHGFCVWEVATKTCTRLREGFGGARLLRWSPRGNFLLVAGFGARDFVIWETHTWTSQSWSTGDSSLVDAAWGGDEGVLVIAFEERVAALHFVKPPPSLEANLVAPFIELPMAAPRDRIESLSWSSSNAALAVAVRRDGGEGGAARHVALYSMQSSPVIAVRHLGDVPDPDRPGDCRATPAFVDGALFVAWGGAVSLCKVGSL